MKMKTGASFIEVLGYFMLWMLVVVTLTALLSLPVQWLWNGCLVPAVSGVSEITWLQSWGLLILFQILIKSSTVNKQS